MEELINCLDMLNIHDENVNEDDTATSIPLCNKMCPIEEMIFREQNGLLHRLELIDTSKWNEYVSKIKRGNLLKHGNFADNNKCVKQYQRPSAGENMYQMDRIRSTNVLKFTIDYLLNDCLTIALNTYSNYVDAFNYYYDFTFDRIRSIRQDLTIQRAIDLNCFYILEKCVEFYIQSHQLSLHLDGKNISKFNSHINLKHLQETLFLLIAFYDLFNDNIWSRWRIRFETLFIMFNLNPDRESTVFKRCQQLRLNKLTSKMYLDQMKLSHSLINSYIISNHYKILRIIRKQKDELISALFFVINVSYHHLQYLKIITIAYKSLNTKLPLNKIADWLCPMAIDHCLDYVEHFCKNYSLPIELSNVDHFNDNYSTNNVEKYLLIKDKFKNINEWIITEQIKPVNWLPKLSENIFHCIYHQMK